MENIFKNAKFGDKFLTRDGRVAIYINRDAMRFYYLGIEPCTVSGTKIDTVRYNVSGKVDGYRDSLDIVSRYQEPLDKDRLDKTSHNYKMGYNDGLADGYLKAMEEQV